MTTGRGGAVKIFVAIAVCAAILLGCAGRQNAAEESTVGDLRPSAERPPPMPFQKPVVRIPIAPIAGTQRDLVVNVGDRVFFDVEKSDLTAKARATLDRQVAWLKQHLQRHVLVEGHCDARGTREYNLALGKRRAEAVRDYLLNSGIAADRIETVSYGKERPVALRPLEESWSQNRRAVTVVRN